MTIEEQLTETMRQYNECMITAKEMLNKIFEVLGHESEEFWKQFPEPVGKTEMKKLRVVVEVTTENPGICYREAHDRVMRERKED